jgi:gliding motility-associated-like protein
MIKNRFKHIRFFFFVFVLFLYYPTLAQVDADFEAQGDTTSCTSFLVQFTNNSSGTGTLTYEWDFGGLGTSTQQNPEFLFTIPGSYDIELVVTNGTDYDTLTRENYIVYFNSPNADFSSPSDLLGCLPLTVDFTDGSTPGDGDITSWSWFFGDGSESEETNATYTYTTAGDFDVILEVQDENGCQDIMEKEEFVSVKNPPVANFSADQTASCLESLDVQFSNFSTGFGVLNFDWDFGDGDTSSETDPLHTYSGLGSYNVRLAVEDANECTDTITKEDFIVLSEIQAAFELASDTICPGVNVPLNNTSIGAASYVWNFGDGSSPVLEEEPEYAYTTSGEFVITLSVFAGPQCSSTYTDTVFVEDVTALFESTPSYACQVPFTVTYTNQSLNAVSYEWHFGNGNISTEENPTNEFVMTPTLELYNQAVYSDTLYATTSSGCTSRYIAENNVQIILPQAKFTPNEDTDPDALDGCGPLTVEFRDTSEYISPTDNIISYNWDFGDGDVSDQEIVSHEFDEAGEFTVELTITTELGCTDTASATVKVGSFPVAEFELVGDDEVCASTSVEFRDLSTADGDINGWNWYFSDGLTATEQNPLHAFLDTGYVSVTLVALYNGCESEEFTIDSVVRILPPVSTFSEEVNCESPTDFQFTGNIQGADEYTWDFGDDSPVVTDEENPNHVYAEGGDYLVSLSSTNNESGCNYYMPKSIGVRDIKADFSQDFNIGCAGLEVTFDATDSRDFFTYDIQGTAGSFLWDFGDGSSNLFTEDTVVSHVFENRGRYNISLVVKDINGCTDTMKSFVKIYQPYAAFTADTTIGCIPFTVNFSDTTITDTTITFRSWYFGDDTFGSLANETHVYSNIGTYSVNLEVENILGCNDTVNKDAYILATKPVPEFSANDQTVCVGDTVYFTNEALSSYESLLWSFGDGNTSIEENPFHIFADSGRYNVSLQLFDILGCDSILEKPGYIHVQSFPVVDFNASITDTSCYPAFIDFTDLTIHPYKDSWEWDFGLGDGSSTLQNPTFAFTQPGIFDVKLTVGTTYGCFGDTVFQDTIKITGPYAEIAAPDSACPRVIIEFDAANQSNVAQARWNFGDGIQELGEYTFEDYGEFFDYFLFITDAGGCNVTFFDSIYIHAFEGGFELDNVHGCIPFIIEPLDTSIGATQWNWEFGNGDTSSDQNPTYTYNEIDTVELLQIIENDFACIDTVTKEIIVYALPDIDILTMADTLICVGDQFQLLVDGGNTYEWSPSTGLDDPNTAFPMASPQQNITYIVEGTDINGCATTDTISIFVQQQPVIDSISVDTTVIVGELVELGATFSRTMEFYWSPDVNISCLQCQYPVVKMEEPQVYTFTVVDSSQCFEITHDVTIDVQFEYTVDVPTAFAPEGNYPNNEIKVRGWGIFELVEFSIYNRFGQKVFTTDDIEVGWDGTYQGKDQPVDTYVYTVIVESYDGTQREKTGSFRLLR